MREPRSQSPRRPSCGTKPRSTQAAALAAVLTLASVAAAQSLDCLTFSRGGAIIPPTGPSLGNVIVLGQPIAGLACALVPDEDPPPEFNLNLTFGVGFIPCLIKPTCDLTTDLIEWVGADGNYGLATNWSPTIVPDNDPGIRYRVLVRPRINDATPTVTLNFNPSISRLTMEAGATIEVNANSGSDGAILFSGYGGAFEAVNATSQGLIQINATDADNDFLISDMHIDQTGGGVLRATGTVTGTLRLIQCRIVGGTIESSGSGQVELYDSIIVAPAVQGSAGVTIRPFGANPETTVQGLVTNASQIRVETGAELVTTGVNASFTGNGRVLLANEASSTLGGPEGLLTNGVAPAAAHRIEGAGYIVGRLLNNGIVDANVAGDVLDIDVPANLPPVPTYARNVVNTHVLRATAGGTLRISSAIHNLGQIAAHSGGIVDIDGPISGTGSIFLSGGAMFIDVVAGPMSCGDVEVRPGSTSTFTVTGSTVACDDLTIAGGTATLQPRQAAPTALTASGALTLCPDTGADPAAVAVLVVNGSSVAAESVHVCVGPGVNPPGGGALHVGAGGSVACGGDFSFDALDETDFTWALLAPLRMNGGVGLPDNDPSLYGTLEVGGLDLGVNPALHVGAAAGYSGNGGNFHLEELVIGPDAHVKLVDAYDNGSRIDSGFGSREALYVHRVTFADGQGRLNLNGLHLYYEALTGAAAQITGLLAADANCDGVVDFFDIDPFLIALFNPAQYAVMYPNCDLYASDADQNGFVDFFDIDPFLEALFD